MTELTMELLFGSIFLALWTILIFSVFIVELKVLKEQESVNQELQKIHEAVLASYSKIPVLKSPSEIKLDTRMIRRKK